MPDLGQIGGAQNNGQSKVHAHTFPQSFSELFWGECHTFMGDDKTWSNSAVSGGSIQQIKFSNFVSCREKIALSRVFGHDLVARVGGPIRFFYTGFEQISLSHVNPTLSLFRQV